jgi:hypothetical protein
MEHRMDRDCGEGPHGGFRHILPFLAIPLAIGLIHGLARHKFAHMGEMRREAWKNGVPPMFAELHRRAHAAEAAEAAKLSETQAGSVSPLV